MKSLGCDVVRFHISPVNPTEEGYPGLYQGQYIEMLDRAVLLQNRYQLPILLDIGNRYDYINEELVTYYVTRYSKYIKYFQIGNEIYNHVKQPDGMKKLINLMRLCKKLAPNAKISADVLAEDLLKLKTESPNDYELFDFHLIHYYSMTDYRGWNDVFIDDLAYHCGWTGIRPDLPKGYYKHDWFSGLGFGTFDKESWITEVCAIGYFRWGGVIKEEQKAYVWPEIVAAAIRYPESKVTRICHHSFRDKMSWREFGLGQTGLLYYDGAPRALTWEFKEQAFKYAPENSILRKIRVDIESANINEISLYITNFTDANIFGELSIEFGSKKIYTQDFELEADITTHTLLPLENLSFKPGNNHIFVKYNCSDDKDAFVYGWNVIKNPIIPKLDTKIPKYKSVTHKDGLDSINDFINKYHKDLGIVIAPGIGIASEMAYRLKITLQALLCSEIPIRMIMNCEDVLDKPLILLGVENENILQVIIETSTQEEDTKKIRKRKGDFGWTKIINQPFGNDRNCTQAYHFGIHYLSCPAVLSIGATTPDGLKAVTYDLIKRYWQTGLKPETAKKHIDKTDMLDM